MSLHTLYLCIIEDDEEYIEDYGDNLDIDSVYGRSIDDFPEARTRYQKPSRVHTLNFTERNINPREFPTKALTKSSRPTSEQDMWSDNHYLNSIEDQCIDDGIHQYPNPYNNRNQMVSV